MTLIEKLEQSWHNLEADIQLKLQRANTQAGVHTSERCRNRDPESMFPSMQSTGELISQTEAGAYASVLDLIHTAMRELGLHYPTER
jgi:hypothetical protein